MTYEQFVKLTNKLITENNMFVVENEDYEEPDREMFYMEVTQTNNDCGLFFCLRGKNELTLRVTKSTADETFATAYRMLKNYVPKKRNSNKGE